MKSLAVSLKRVQRFEGKLNIYKESESLPEPTGVTSLVAKDSRG